MRRTKLIELSSRKFHVWLACSIYLCTNKVVSYQWWVTVSWQATCSKLNYLEFSFCQQNLENSRFCQKNRENSRICLWFCRKNLGFQNSPYFCVFATLLYRFLYWFWEKNQLFCSLEESWKFKILVCRQNLESAGGICAVDVTRTLYTKLKQLVVAGLQSLRRFTFSLVFCSAICDG